MIEAEAAVGAGGEPALSERGGGAVLKGQQVERLVRRRENRPTASRCTAEVRVRIVVVGRRRASVDFDDEHVDALDLVSEKWRVAQLHDEGAAGRNAGDCRPGVRTRHGNGGGDDGRRCPGEEFGESALRCS